MSSDHLEVEIVDDAGRTVGSAAKLDVHLAPGICHRAFSLFAVTGDGRLVLQRRAASKYHSPNLLTNTACGHPLPGESPSDAVQRRCAEELGVRPNDCTEVSVVRYHVIDERTGLHEFEHNHVFTARIEDGTWSPDPEEASEVIAVDERELRRLRAAEGFTAWFDAVFEAALASMEQRGFGRETTGAAP